MERGCSEADGRGSTGHSEDAKDYEDVVVEGGGLVRGESGVEAKHDQDQAVEETQQSDCLNRLSFLPFPFLLISEYSLDVNGYALQSYSELRISITLLIRT